MRWAIPTIIGNVMIVRNKKMRTRSKNEIGNFEPSNNPPTSDMKMSWVTETQAMTNRVNSLSMPLPRTAGAAE